MKNSKILICVALIATTCVSKAAVQVDGIWYEFNGETASVLPRNGHYYTNYSVGDRYEGDIIIPETIVKNNNTYTITGIKENAFRDCPHLTSVTIPNTITSVGEAAFSGSTRLSEPVYNDHIFACLPTSFSGEYVIPEGIETICGYAFSGCTGLTSIEIPSTVTSIKNRAFLYCTGLTSVTIPNSVTTMESFAFYSCSGLTEINIPTSVTNIATHTFSYCDHLSSIVIPSNVQSIGTAFQGCSSLATVTIEAITPPRYNGDVFNGCDNLMSIYVPCGSLSNYKEAGGWKNHEAILKYFELPYTITAYAEHGNVFCPHNICDGDALVVSPDYGYHFAQWFDENTENPRTIFLTQDTTFTAVCEINNYELTITSNSPEIGIVNDISGTYDHGYSLELSASAMVYGYSFDYWSITSQIPEDAITISQAMQLASNLENGVASRKKYKIYGYVTRNYESYQNSYYLDDDPNQLGSFVVYKAMNQAQIGDFILIEAYLYKYNNTLETYLNGIITPLQQKIYQNPYSLTVKIRSAITAYFKPNKYGVNLLCDDKGIVTGNGSYDYLSNVQISATSNYGYHFVQWSDGNTDNPRIINLTQDTTFTAEFGINQYTVNVTCDETYGHIEGENGSFDYLTTHEYKAIANYGYHFDRWSDGKTQNPRTITINADINITALFAPNKYIIQDGSNSSEGYISGIGSYDYLSERTITAVNQYGYHFVKWSDGITENPRTITITQDTTFTAIFAIDKSGVCGVNNELIWTYEDKSKTLTISGTGALTSNYTFGIEAPTQMQNLIIGNEVTSIGDRAFYAKSTLNHLTIGGNVTSIGDYAFAECKNFDDITCYATTVPTISDKTFYNVGNKQYIYLYVPVDRERAYKRDVNWGEFDIQIKGAEATTIDGGVVVVPTDNTVEITWPSVNKAETYEIVITKDGDVVCTLIFNANGQLAGIAFAPGRNGSNHTQQAQTAGFKFIVTGLTGNTTYNYAVASKDNTGNTIDTKSGSFTTTGGEQGLEDSVIETQKANKLLRDGQVLILRGDKTYTLQGQEVK